jgi:uncharacterized protein (DUF1501 family)
MIMKADASRRRFLQLSSGVLATSSVLTLGAAHRAFASTSPSGYKALVCLYLNGGNNGHNWVVPISQSAYNVYATGRQGLALPQSSLLPLQGASANGITYGLHPSCPELQALFNAATAAIVGNVGPLIQPTTVAQARAGSVPLPPQIFSHLNQSNEWQTGVPQSLAPYGWGGRIADLFVSQGIAANLAFNISVAGSNTWQQGQTTNPYALGVNGAPLLSATNDAGYRNGLRQQATQALIDQGAGDANLLVSADSSIFQSSATKVTLVNDAFAAAGDLVAPFPAAQPNDWGLSQQLNAVARVIKAQPHIGDTRQLFFVQLGGFDTHTNELATQAELLGYVSQYVNAFWNAMIEIGMQKNVTLFTMSDFGRTLTSNGSGADHGWGNHHIVVGGAVVGAKFYGTMPNLTLGGPDDFGQGRLVPSTSADQYAATLANWFGVSDSNLNSIFSNLPNFPVRILGFMG